MRHRFLEIHFSSSKGRIARSIKIPLLLLIVISLLVFSLLSFLLISSIIYFSSSNNIDNFNKNIYQSELDSNQINFINPISATHLYVSKAFDVDHQAIDIVAEKKSNVLASSTGRVIHSGDDNIYGKIIILAHKNNFYTFYGHLDTIFVKKHEFVDNKQLIGLVGDTGQTTGPHLHFEIWDNIEVKDPILLIKELKEKDVTKKR